MCCAVAPAKEALGTPGTAGDPWGHGLCLHAEKEVETPPQGTIRGGGFGACSRVWVLEVGEVSQPGLPPALWEKRKGEIMGVIFSFLMKMSLFALVEKPISCSSKTLPEEWWGQLRGTLQTPLQGVGQHRYFWVAGGLCWAMAGEGGGVQALPLAVTELP